MFVKHENNLTEEGCEWRLNALHHSILHSNNELGRVHSFTQFPVLQELKATFQNVKNTY